MFVFLLCKLAFVFSVVGVASICLIKFARSGREFRAPLVLSALPFFGVIAIAAISLSFAPSSHWETMAVGNRWLEYLLSIPIIAVLPFAAIVWALRIAAAPTDLMRTGTFAGLIAGGVSATAYALHCTDDSLAFVAIWYGGTIALCALAGATLGPRLLRWRQSCCDEGR